MWCCSKQDAQGFFSSASGMGDTEFCFDMGEDGICICAPRCFGNLNCYESLHYRVRDLPIQSDFGSDNLNPGNRRNR